jgi:hypothetical protein
MLDIEAAGQLRAALELARLDLVRGDTVPAAQEIIARAEQYAAFLLCGQSSSDAIFARRSTGADWI